jgi:hypothetical protein
VAVAGPPLSSAAIADDIWLTRFRTTLVAVLGGTVAGIGCLAFYTSFEAIRAYAVRSHGIAPEHAWAVPLLVNSFIVVAIGADLWFTTTKTRRAWWEQWWPKLLLAGAAGVSFVLNIAHAQPTWAARGVAAIPPAALVLGVELLMMVLRRATMLRAARLQAQLDAEQAAAMQAPVQRARLQVEALRRRDGETLAGGSGRLPRPAVERQAPGQPPAAAVAEGIQPRRGRREPPLGASMRAAATPVAARILQQRGDAATLSPHGLVAALASEGVTVDLRTAQALLAELRPPLSSLLAARRPPRPGSASGQRSGLGDRPAAPRPD